jgi:hypothetical protein
VHYHARSHTVISVDIVNSSEGGSLRHTRLVEALHETIGTAMAECPLGATWLPRRDGDSMTIAVPANVGKGQVLGEFPPRVERELQRYNSGRTPEAQLWFRMAVAHGDVVVDGNGQLLGGEALVEAARIRDIDPLREAMDAAPEAYIGLILTDEVYRTSVRDGDPALTPNAYHRVEAKSKSYQGTAWIRLLGIAPPRHGGPGGPREPRTPTPGPRPPSGDISISTNHGIAQTGPDSVAVMRNG